MQPNQKKLKPKRRKLPMNPNKVTTPITGSIPSYTWEEIAKNLTQIREDNNPLRRKVATVKEENNMWDKLMSSTEIYDNYQVLKESCEILERYNKNQRETIIQLQKDSKDLYDARRQNKNLSANITRLNQDLQHADEEFGILEDAYDYLVDKLAQSTREIDRKESLIKDYQGALDRADRSNNSLKDQLAKLEANQPHPGDVKMGAIIKKAYQDLQAAELEKNLCKPQDYEGW